MSKDRRLLTVIALLIPLLGCATYSQVFVNASGQVATCSMTGGGLIGMAMAEGAVSDCSANMRAAGFLEIERAGVIGIICADPKLDEAVHVLKVVEGSPAYFAGVESGDFLLEVESQAIFSSQEALLLLFGEAGTDVSVRFQRGEFDTVITFTRVPRSLIYGQEAARTRR